MRSSTARNPETNLDASLPYYDFPMVVAVTVMGMMEMAVDQVVGVIAMRNLLVAAVGTVFMGFRMPRATVLRGAVRGISDAHFEPVLVEMIAVFAVQMAIVQVIRMIAVLNRCMAATVPVHMRVRFMNPAILRQDFPLSELPGNSSLACARALLIKSTTCWSVSE
jgi:hypothetical protein